MNILVVSNRFKDSDLYYGRNVVKTIEGLGDSFTCRLIFENQINSVMFENYDLIIGIGGDGTVLHLIHSFPNTPVFCFNKGRVGFLADGDINKIFKTLTTILIKNEYKVVENSFIQASFNNEVLNGVNDILIGKSNMLGTIELTLFINNEMVKTFICDGILISSGLGSSAYNLSLGGPLLYNSFEAMCINVIGSKDLSFPKIVVPSNTEIMIKVSSRKNSDSVGLLGVDGEHIVRTLHGNEEIRFNYSNQKYQLLKMKNYTYMCGVKSKILGQL